MARRGSLKRRLRSLIENESERRRDLGGLVLEMYRRDELDTETLGSRASEIANVSDEIDGLRRELGEEAAEPEVEREAATEAEPTVAAAAATLPASEPSVGSAGTEPNPEQQVHAQLGYDPEADGGNGADMPEEPNLGPSEQLSAEVADGERRLQEAAAA